MNVDSLLIYSCQSLDGEGDFISLSIRFIFSFYLFIIQSGSLSSFYLSNEDELFLMRMISGTENLSSALTPAVVLQCYVVKRR